MLEGKRRRKERREDKVKGKRRLFRKAGEREQRTGNGADGGGKEYPKRQTTKDFREKGKAFSNKQAGI